MAELNTAARLTICSPAKNIRRTAPKKHPIHYAAFDSKYRKVLSKSFHKGDAYAAIKELRQLLEEHGIFVVPVGELECFVKEVGGHGPEWVNKVIETYPDLSNGVYDEAKRFIQSMNL